MYGEAAEKVWGKDAEIVATNGKRITGIAHIKSFEDPIFGNLLLGTLTYEGEKEVKYTYIWRLDENSLPPRELWRLLESSQKHPEHGYLPKLLAYSSNGDMKRGYLDKVNPQQQLQDDLIGNGSRDDHILNFGSSKVRALYFEPFPENLKLQLQRRSKDKLPYSEEEILLLLTTAIKVCCESHARLSTTSDPPIGFPITTSHWKLLLA